MGEPNVNATPTNVSAGRISAVGGPSGFIQQADMRRLKLGFRQDGRGQVVNP